MPEAEPFNEDEFEDWKFARYRVTFRHLLGARTTYDVFTRCGEHKAVAIALRYHLLGPNDFFTDFPLNIGVDPLDGSEQQPSDLGDPNED